MILFFINLNCCIIVPPIVHERLFFPNNSKTLPDNEKKEKNLKQNKKKN